MTNERAIELLNRISDSQFDGPHGDERREALEMAVRALSGDGDTISRQAAIDALSELREKTVASESFRIGLYRAIEEIEQLPSAQPERKTGRWKLLYDNIWICTNCEQTEQFGVNIESTSDYCPNCGARMER